MNDYTPRAQQVLAYACMEAEELHHNFIGCEHLFLGVIRLGVGHGFELITLAGISIESAREEVRAELLDHSNSTKPASPPYTPRAKKAFAVANREAKRMNHSYVGSEHLLLALLIEDGGTVPIIMANLNMDVPRLRADLISRLTNQPMKANLKELLSQAALAFYAENDRDDTAAITIYTPTGDGRMLRVRITPQDASDPHPYEGDRAGIIEHAMKPKLNP